MKWTEKEQECLTAFHIKHLYCSECENSNIVISASFPLVLYCNECCVDLDTQYKERVFNETSGCFKIVLEPVHFKSALEKYVYDELRCPQCCSKAIYVSKWCRLVDGEYRLGMTIQKDIDDLRTYFRCFCCGEVWS